MSNVSGLITAAIMAVSFLLSAILIPVAAHLPRWIEFEIVLGVWWATWFLVSAGLLFRGVGVDDDAPSPKIPLGTASGCSSNGVDCYGCDIPYVHGCGEFGMAVVVLVLAILALWVLVEFVLPAVAFATYWMIVRLLGRVVNDRNDCKGSAFRAIFWGFAWATLYTLPLVALVWGFHFLHGRV